MEITNDIKIRIETLNKKFEASGQDLLSYLDGLIHAKYLTYWDYIQLDNLLSMQNPKTNIPDEPIFIMYHQITELYFKLCLHELKQIKKCNNCDDSFLILKIKRINSYFNNLIQSFEIMIDGMEHEQFLNFRMSLLPASGFQSVQYRMIELYCTKLENLIAIDKRSKFENDESHSIAEMYENIYWKFGATDSASGAKSLTLEQFEEKYDRSLLRLIISNFSNTVFDKIEANFNADKSNSNSELANALRDLDLNVNVYWPLAHYKSAVKYLNKGAVDKSATGGTNWQKYLPPRFQKRIFFPMLWTEQQKAEWGKQWVEKIVGV